MSGNGELLPIPQGLELPDFDVSGPRFYGSRSAWLGTVEDMLRPFYPAASSRDLALTARHVAPFFLTDGPNVP